MQSNSVGILFNSNLFRGIPRAQTGQESIANYEEVARMYGLTPYYLRLKDIDVGSGCSHAYVYNGYNFIRKVVPTPSVIHNRAIYPNRSAHRVIHQLIDNGTLIFNVNNRYGKDTMHQLLASDPHLSSYLPMTALASVATVNKMMNQYSDLILKPCKGSVGRGIYRLVRLSKEVWSVAFASSKDKPRHQISKFRYPHLPEWLRRKIAQTPYLIQERIPLAEYNGRPLDLRISVQRGFGGAWQVTGMFAKVSSPQTFVSNIARGAHVYPADLLLCKIMSPAEATSCLAHIEELSLAIALFLERHLPQLADLGLDIGITSNGRPYFIECNGRDQRYGFLKAGMEDTWKQSYHQPLAYAAYLLHR